MDKRSHTQKVPSVSLKEAKRIFDAGSAAVFVDVRSRFAYDQAHILNADSLPLDYIEDLWEAFSPDQELILYDDSLYDQSAEEAAMVLRDKGFTRIKILREGLEGWQRAGYPISRELLMEDSVEIQPRFTEPWL